MDRYTIVLALSQNGTLYAGAPRMDRGFGVRRYRPRGPRADRDISFEGALTAVEPSDGSGDPEYVVSCDGRVFRIIEGFPGPVVGSRMLAGYTDGHHEISSPIAWVGVCDIERTWALDPMFRAFRNGARDWRRFLTEQPYEQGDEHIDDESGELRANALERHYRDYLLDLARTRDEHLMRLGHDLLPLVHRVVSNEDVATDRDRLCAALAGEGMALVSFPVRKKHSGAIASSLDRCLGGVRRLKPMELEASAEAEAA